jgi:hypothetical protein
MVDTNHNIKDIIEKASKVMNEKDDIKLRYYDFLEEQRRINDSIINEVKTSGIKEGIQQTKVEMILNMHNKNISLDINAE